MTVTEQEPTIEQLEQSGEQLWYQLMAELEQGERSVEHETTRVAMTSGLLSRAFRSAGGEPVAMQVNTRFTTTATRQFRLVDEFQVDGLEGVWQMVEPVSPTESEVHRDTKHFIYHALGKVPNWELSTHFTLERLSGEKDEEFVEKAGREVVALSLDQTS